MVDSPVFSTYVNQPSYTRYSPTVVGGISSHRKPATHTSSPKVVSIPVHFVGSDATRSTSALKIQKAFRGFLVRKCVKKIASIKKEVDEIEQRISKEETVELIRREPKERLRINEMLMASLFKLDSVRGIDFGVRDCRKAVIKKAIALQEKVDALDDSNMAMIAEAYQVPEITDSAMFSVNFDDGEDQKIECRGELVDHIINDSTAFSIENSVDCNIRSDQTTETNNLEAEPRALMEINEVGVVDMDDEDPHCDVKGLFGNCNSTPCILSGGVETCPFADDWSKGSVNNSYQSLTEGERGIDLEEKVHQDEEQQIEEEEEKSAAVGHCNENKAIADRIRKDNEKMMRMMSDLIERNEMQTRMLTSLTQRVGQLEKAFLCDKLLKTKGKRLTQLL